MIKPTTAELAAMGIVKVVGTQSLYRDPKTPDLTLKLVDTLADAAACGGIYGWDQGVAIGRWFVLGGMAHAVAKGTVPAFTVPGIGKIQGMLRGLTHQSGTAEIYACNLFWGAEQAVKVLGATIVAPRFLAVVAKGIQGAGYMGTYVGADPSGFGSLVSTSTWAKTSAVVRAQAPGTSISGDLVAPAGVTSYYSNAALYQDLQIMPDMGAFFKSANVKARVLADVPDDIYAIYSNAYDLVANLGKYQGMQGTLKLIYSGPKLTSAAVATDVLKLHLVTKLGTNTWRYNTQGSGSVAGTVTRAITGGPSPAVLGPAPHAGARLNPLLARPIYGVPSLAHEWNQISGISGGSSSTEYNEYVDLNGTVPFKSLRLTDGQDIDFREVLVGLAPYNVSRGNFGVETLQLNELLQNAFDYLRSVFDMSGVPAPIPSDPLALDVAANTLQVNADSYVITESFLESAYRLGNFVGACFQFIEEVANTARSRNATEAVQIGFAPPDYRDQMFFTATTPAIMEFRGDRLLLNDGAVGGAAEFNYSDALGGDLMFRFSSLADYEHRMVGPSGVVNIPGRSGSDFAGRTKLGPLGEWGGFFSNAGAVTYISYNFTTNRFEESPVVASHTPVGLEWWARSSAGVYHLYRTTFPTATSFETRLHTVVSGALDAGTVLTGKRVVAVRSGFAVLADASVLSRHPIGSVIADTSYSGAASGLTGIVTVAASAFTALSSTLLDGSTAVTGANGFFFYGDVEKPYGTELPEFLLRGPWKRNATYTELISLSTGRRVPCSARINRS